MPTAYYPQTDGQADKANLMLAALLKAYFAHLDNTGEWDQLLPRAELTYNAAKREAIGMPPFEADISYLYTKTIYR